MSTVVRETAHSRTETTTTQFRILGVCRKCGKASSALATRITVRTYSDRACLPHRSSREVWPNAVECCGRQVARTPVKGVRNDTPCDDRCTEAKGHKCECSCGGKNHGAEHA